ncbi:sensor histidine kinase [Sphingosinicella sp. YJ22]|uniref:sensor histidine kinase n=1 Tax=Sphingosinicella sp. YJ22 TaxID=1104780 RepID=UPI00140B6477|nr:sensor histidine kinase [Sphingosinicella sp. YJ22]
MTERQQNPVRAWFGGLPTATKMLLILGAALLPLLVISVLASIESARDSRSNALAEANTNLALSAQRLSSVVNRAALIVRIASDAVRRPETAALACQHADAQLRASGSPPVRFLVYDPGGGVACPPLTVNPAPAPRVAAGATSAAWLDPQGELLRLWLYDAGGRPLGQIEFPRASLEAAANLGSTTQPTEIELAVDDSTMRLFASQPGQQALGGVVLREPITASGVELRLHAAAPRMSWEEVLMIVLPLLMWLLAAVVGWLVVQYLLLNPLLRMQRAIAAYVPGDRGFERPTVHSAAREIDDLGNAFAEVTRTVARHEADLEAAVERQTRLVREVHHRVKNNLQVVASLLNIHSRSSVSDEAAAAYASIQRRVDALAVVHRNHYAELEENRGVALKALVSELAANLRATAPTGAAGMQIRLALEPLYATQDVAVSTAFLVTEVVEFGMLCGARIVAIALEPEQDGRARLVLESEVLAGKITCSPDVQERFDRIVSGLARQLRSTLERDGEAGRYSLTIAVVDRDTPAVP